MFFILLLYSYASMISIDFHFFVVAMVLLLLRIPVAPSRMMIVPNILTTSQAYILVL
jgi:hypothetical protein